VILPSLRSVVLDEGDRLLELGFLEQVDALLDARPNAQSLATWVAEEARELAERRASQACADGGGGGSSSGGGAAATALDARERQLRLLAGAVGLPVAPAGAAAAAASSVAPAPVPVRVRVAMLSATMPSGIEELAMTVLADPLRCVRACVRVRACARVRTRAGFHIQRDTHC
jgi:superfamily II DNA/RNA helicase